MSEQGLEIFPVYGLTMIALHTHEEKVDYMGSKGLQSLLPGVSELFVSSDVPDGWGTWVPRLEDNASPPRTTIGP
jgi:hypothetical protein